MAPRKPRLQPAGLPEHHGRLRRLAAHGASTCGHGESRPTPEGRPRSTFTFLPLDIDVIENPPPPSIALPAAYNYVGAFGHVALKVFGLVSQTPSDVIEAPTAVAHQVWPKIANDTAWPIIGPWPDPEDPPDESATEEEFMRNLPLRPPYVGDDLLKLVMFMPVRGRY